MALKIKNVQVIEDSDWDDLVKKTYGRPYCFQQQNDCRDRGVYHLTIPSSDASLIDEGMAANLSEGFGEEMGVKMATWLARDPLAPVAGRTDYVSDLWWERHFYPDIQVVANDLYTKGLIPAGDYTINIDW